MPTIADSPRPARILLIDADASRAAHTAAALRPRLACTIDCRPAPVDGPDADLAVVVVDGANATPRDSLLRRLAPCRVIILASRASDADIVGWIGAGADDAVDVRDAAGRALGDAVIRSLARVPQWPLAFPAPRSLPAHQPVAKRAGRGRLNALVAFLQAAALTDPLTGLANRRALDARLERLWIESVRDSGDLSILMIDVDNFKRVNDRAGHARGDAVLVALAASVRAQCRKADLAARFGGDEVVVLLPKVGAEQARVIADRIRADFESRIGAGEGTGTGAGGCVCSLSVGVASREYTSAASAAELMERADRALYDAKAGGKCCTRVSGASAAPRLAAM